MFDTYWYDYADCNDINELISKAIAKSRTEYVWLRHRAVDYSHFNLRFMPHKHQADMIHAWASHDNPQCYTTWLIPIHNNGEMFYHDKMLPILNLPTWNTSDCVEYSDFNFNWYPDVWDWHKQHHFAMAGTTQLAHTSVGNGSEIKYHSSNLRYKEIGIWYDTDSIQDSPYEWNWLVDSRIDYSDFNFNWLPDAWDSDKIHEFSMWGTEQLSYTRLLRREHTNERVYHFSYLFFKDIPKLHELVPTDSEWVWIIDERIDYSNFNFNWLPDAWDINKTHAFAMDGTEQLCYTFLHNTKVPSSETKYHDAKLKFDPTKPNHEWVWERDERVDYSNFNFGWLPDAWDSDKTHVFCMAGTQQLGYTKLINTKNSNPKTVYHRSHLRFLPQVRPVIYWQDYTHELNLDAIKHLAMGSEWTWIADRRIDYSKWDFEWLPDGWDTNYIHAFTMEDKQQLSYTMLVHRDAITNFVDFKYHLSNLQFNKKHSDMCLLNTGIGDKLQIADFQVRLITTMEESIKSAVKKSTSEWLWIYSDCCEYSDFDWSWLPDLDQRDQVHCWPSGTCEKGDTFLIHVPSFNGEKIKFNFEHVAVNRKRWPNIKINCDSLAQELNNTPRLNSIYTVYSYTGFADYPDVCLWDKRPVVSINKNNSTTLVPRDCVVKDELYEYPHLLRYPQYGFDTLSDIIFISYDEPEADANWNKLVDKFPHAKRVHGVSGMENALKAAATTSETPYFYAVFAKTIIYPTFNFDIGADYWQKPKHYIFYSENTVNGLRYGHMGIVLYNRDMVINAPPFGEFGTDYTLSFAHEVVPIVSCYGSFDASPYHTWRTAFREAHKLREFTDTMPNVETEYRLHVWRTVANGNYAEWALKGANDGVKYYEDNIDTPELRRNTFRWEWLRNHFTELYGDVQ